MPNTSSTSNNPNNPPPPSPSFLASSPAALATGTNTNAAAPPTHDQLSRLDDDVKEYLLYRGFTSSIATFESERYRHFLSLSFALSICLSFPLLNKRRLHPPTHPPTHPPSPTNNRRKDRLKAFDVDKLLLHIDDLVRDFDIQGKGGWVGG